MEAKKKDKKRVTQGEAKPRDWRLMNLEGKCLTFNCYSTVSLVLEFKDDEDGKVHIDTGEM